MKASNQADRRLARLLTAVLLFVLTLAVLLFLMMGKGGLPAFKEFGLRFFQGKHWNPVMEEYTALPFIFGTVVTSLISLAIATPFSLSLALFNTEVAPRFLRTPFTMAVEVLAAIPSIIYGMWALFTLVPFIRDDLAPFLRERLDYAIFQGPAYGTGILAASMVLALMIIPTITAVATEIFRSVSPMQKEAVLGLGGTRSEMIFMTLLKPHKRGILAAMILGLGRALGETMAVAMVVGNRPQIANSIFSQAATLSSVIANEYAEAGSDLHLASLTALAVVLFIVSLAINAIAKLALRGEKA